MTRTSRAAERQPAWRKPLIIGVVALLAVVAGAAIALALTGTDGTASGSPTPSASPSADPSETPEPMDSPTSAPAESETPAATDAPTETPTPTAEGEVAVFPAWQSVRVTVDGLAVRRGPGTSHDLVSDYRFDTDTNTEVLETEEVRLDAGHFLWVEDGPLVINDVAWYRVYDSLAQAEPRDDIGRWDADGDEFRSDPGWVAGGSGSDAYLVPDEAPEPDGPVHGEGPDPYAIAFGTGDGQTDVFDLGLPVSARWAAAAPDGGSCSIVIRLEPAGIERHRSRSTSGPPGTTSGRRTWAPAQAVTTGSRSRPIARGAWSPFPSRGRRLRQPPTAGTTRAVSTITAPIRTSAMPISRSAWRDGCGFRSSRRRLGRQMVMDPL